MIKHVGTWMGDDKLLDRKWCQAMQSSLQKKI